MRMMIIAWHRLPRLWVKEDDYRYFLNRALSYQTLIDPETKYMRGKDSQGNWRTPFTPVAYQGPRICKWMGGYYGRLYCTIYLVCTTRCTRIYERSWRRLVPQPVG